MREDFDLTNFTAGELSPRLKGRVDYAKYFDGADTLLNMVVMPQGGITRRPGTNFINAVLNQAAKPRLRRFQFSNQQAYMLEFGPSYVRVYRNDGLVLNVQAVTNALNNGAGLIRLVLASAIGLYTGNSMTVTGVLGTVEANGTWSIANVIDTQSVLGTANNGNGGVRLQVASTANFINGGTLTVTGVGGTIEANGTWPCLIVDATHVDLQASTYANAFTSGGSVSGNDAFQVDLTGSAFVHAYTSGGSTSTGVEIPTPYQEADLATLYFSESDDALFIFSLNYPTAMLNRSSNTFWSYVLVVFRDGPYLDVNVTTTTLSIGASSRVGGRQVTKYGPGGFTLQTDPGVSTHSVLITASSTFGINATPQNVGQGFLSTDVGRHLRIKLMASWCWLIIEVVNSPTQVVATIQPTVFGGAWGNLDGAQWVAGTYYPTGVMVTQGGNMFQCVQAGISSTAGSGGGPVKPASGATTTLVPDGTVVWNYVLDTVPASTVFWQLGKWSVGVYPAVGTFWQQRLFMLGTSLQPDGIDASNTGDFTNMAPTQQDGTVTSSNALSWVLSDDQVNIIQWVKAAGAAQAAQLAIGTVGEEHIMQAASTAQPLTATNVQVYGETSIGTAPIEPLRIGKSLIFSDRAGRKILEWTFNWQVNGYNPVELSKASEHVTINGVTAMLYAQAPHRLIWALRADGTLISATYNKDEQVFAPARHVLGGQYYGGPPIVESMDVIPSQDLTYDEVWLSVLRTVNGVPFRSIEVIGRFFENAVTPAENATFVDCSTAMVLSGRNATLTVSGLVNTATRAGQPPSWTGTGTVAASAGVFTSADVGSVLRFGLANSLAGKMLIQTYVDSEHVTALVLSPLISLAPVPPFIWTIAPLVTSVSGLSYLSGETVALLGDGADLGTCVVSNTGTVPIGRPYASFVIAGLPYSSTGVTMPYEPQRAAAAATSGKIKRIDTMWVRIFESLGFSFGTRYTDEYTQLVNDFLEAVETRSGNMAMNQAPPLFSGAKELKPSGGWDMESQMVVTTNSPLPLTVLAIFAKADVGKMPNGRP